MFLLDPFQSRLLDGINEQVALDKAIIAQSETGSGKTVIFANITYRYITKSSQDVIIFVNKEKLLDQTRQTIFDWFGVVAQAITSKTTIIDTNCRVFVVMVETFFKRTVDFNFMQYFKNVGLCIVDEAHIGNFKKVLPFFATALRIGFTATPISAVKKDPLNKYYKSIVVGPTPQELMEINRLNPKRGIVDCKEYAPKNIDRSKLKLRGDEFTEESVNEAFIGNRQISNTIEAYVTKAFGFKTMCFNSSIEHSLDVTEAMRKEKLNVRHINGSSPKQEYRRYSSEAYLKETYKWFKHTPNAVMCNVGMATTGFDETSIMCVINNSAMMSIPLFRQKRGRGGRPHQFSDGTFKEYFVHLDMGSNIDGKRHLRWEDSPDWHHMFHNPIAPVSGSSPVKTCDECGALNSASARVCTAKIDSFLDDDLECGFIFPFKAAAEDLIPKEMVAIRDGIDVKANIEFFKDRKEYYVMNQHYVQIANKCRSELNCEYLDRTQLDQIFQLAEDKIWEWHKIMGKRKFPNFKTGVKLSMLNELKNVGFLIPVEEVEDDNFNIHEHE